MGRIRLVVEGAVVPKAVALVVGGFHHTVSHRPKGGALRGVWEVGRNLLRLRGAACEVRRFVEAAGLRAAGHLIPLTSVSGCNHGMRNIRPVKLIRGIHLHSGGLAVCANHVSTDMAAGDLRSGELLIPELGHVVAQTAIRDLTADGPGAGRGPRGHRGNGIAVENSAVPCRHAAEGPGNEAGRTAGTHAGTAGHHSVTDIGVALELVGKAAKESAAGSAGCTRSSGRAGSSCAGALEDAARCAAAMPADAGDHPGGHEKLHAHAGAGLGHIEPQGRQIGIELLGGLEEGKHAEQP